MTDFIEDGVKREPALMGCPLCGYLDLWPVVDIPNVPIFCNVLWPTMTAARAAPRGDIALRYCPSCTHLHNRNFDASLLQYAPDYENSLHFSDRFNAFANALAERLVATYGLEATTIVELGCGQGDFLRMVCEAGNNLGIGFDPSYVDEVSSSGRGGGLGFKIHPRRFGAGDHDLSPGLVCCRHVLEHVANPHAFVLELHSWLSNHPETIVYFEVPNVRYTIERGGVWDLIYEHYSYFTMESLVGLFQATGFDICDAREAFGGQYVCVEATVSLRGPRPFRAPSSPAREALGTKVRAFRQGFQSRVAEWQLRLHEAQETGSAIVLWGAGSKGVTFLNMVDPGGLVRSVIDISPRKHGKYVPGTGHEVLPPHNALEHPCDTVILMNPLYEGEVERMLEEFGAACSVELCCA